MPLRIESAGSATESGAALRRRIVCLRAGEGAIDHIFKHGDQRIDLAPDSEYRKDSVPIGGA